MMFKKILIANRGEIAVRAIRACRELGIPSVTLFDKSDINSLHVRQADESICIPSPAAFFDGEAIISLAQERGVDAIYPGYGFLAEESSFAEACQSAGIQFIGPPPQMMELTRNKLRALAIVREAGFAVVESSPDSYGRHDLEVLRAAATDMGFPLVVKPCRGGRGRSARLVTADHKLEETIRQAQESAQTHFRNRQVYLEKAILPAHQVSVQILGDRQGNIIHLGEREGSIMYHNQKVIEESPAPCLTDKQREVLCQTAVAIGHLFQYQNAGSVEFVVTDDGRFYFSEIKARIQVEHTLSEMRTGLDLVGWQIRIAAGERLPFIQADIHLRGWAIMGRIHAEDPWQHFLPSPGTLRRMRVPTGPDIRIDTYAYSGCPVPSHYESLFAKITAWAPDRPVCIARLQRALGDFLVIGLPTNIPLLQQIVAAEAFVNSSYHTGSLKEPKIRYSEAAPHFQDLAVAAAIYYIRRNQQFDPSLPERLLSGWHRESRRLSF